MPAINQMVIEFQKPRRGHPGGCGQRGTQGIRNQIAQEWQFVQFGKFGLVEREAGANSTVGIGLRHGVDDFGLWFGNKETVVLNRGGAASKHLDAAQHGAQIGLARRRAQDLQFRALIEHEDLERQRRQAPFHVIDRRVEMPVDQSGHNKVAIALNHIVGRLRDDRGRNICDAPVADFDITRRTHAVRML